MQARRSVASKSDECLSSYCILGVKTHLFGVLRWDHYIIIIIIIIPQTVLALWGSQLVLRGSEVEIAAAGSGWDPSWDPIPKSLKHQWKTNVFAQKA